MIDILFVNPAAYSGPAKRGPYELSVLKALAEAEGAVCQLLDLQELVSENLMPYPIGFIEAAADQFKKLPAKNLLITLRTTAGPWAIEVAKQFKSVNPSGKVILFAPRIEQGVAAYFKKTDFLDILFLTRGEKTVVPLVRALRGEIPMSSVGSIIYRDEVGTHQTDLVKDEIDLESLPPVPPWINSDKTIASIYTGRGCNYLCSFCSSRQTSGKSDRYISVERIVCEAQKAYDQLDGSKTHFVILEAENLLANRPLIGKLIQLRAEQGKNFLWGCYSRPDLLTEELVEELSQGGCRYLFLGIESGSMPILKRLNKIFDLKKVVPLIKALKTNGILVQNSFIFGVPGETMADILLSAELIANILWAGGKTDWTPLRIESGSPIQKELGPEDYRLLSSSSQYQDLREAGFTPEDIDKNIGYRMWAVKVEYDINKMYLVAESYQDFLSHFPVTSYCLVRGAGLLANKLFLDLWDQYDPNKRLDKLELIDSLIELQPPSIKSFLYDIRDFETRVKGLEAEAKGTNKYNVKFAYLDLLDEPEKTPLFFKLPWWE